MNNNLQFKLKDNEITITTICGPMCAGKSAKLIEIGEEAESSGLNYICYRPEISKRKYDEDMVIKSRSKTTTLKAIPLKEKFEIEDLGNFYEMDKIIFDEIHFLDIESIKNFIKNFIEKCQNTQKQIHIIFAGLDMNFRGEEFKQTSYVSSISNKIIKLTATCKYSDGESNICGAPATHSAKTGGDLNKQLEAASEDIYGAFCEKHWHQMNQIYGVKEYTK